MLKYNKNKLYFSLTAILILTFICLITFKFKEQQLKLETKIEDTILDIENHEIFIKYANGNDILYYYIIASDNFVKILNLNNWELEGAKGIQNSDEYLVIRIAEKYEIIIYSNQTSKIYDYYGALGTYDSEVFFYKTNLDLQTIINFLNNYAESSLTCNVKFEN